MKQLFYGVLTVALIACGQSNREAATETTTETTVTETAQTAATETMATADTMATTDTTVTAPMVSAAKEGKSKEGKSVSEYKDKVVELHTTAGDINIRFFPEVAPNHVKNFIDLSKNGSYNGTKFHRVIPGFMIQGGDPNTISGDPSTWGTGGAGKSNLKAEFNSIPHKRGIVSMARSQSPDSARSQFFIVVADSNFLDNQYTVFGQVTKGMDVADKIVNGPRGAQDRPNNPVSIKSVTVRDAKDDEKGPAPK